MSSISAAASACKACAASDDMFPRAGSGIKISISKKGEAKGVKRAEGREGEDCPAS